MGLENCKFSLKMPQGMQYRLLDWQCLISLKTWNMGGGGGSILIRLQKVSVFSVMADKCTDITAVAELSVFCCWEEDGTPVECFLDIVLLKNTDAESIYLALVIFRLAIL